MANVDYPNGATLVGHLHGAPLNSTVRKYVCPASDGTALFIGQFVKSGGSLSADEDGILRPTITAAAATDTLRGVVVGFERKITDLSVLHREASTLRSVYVCDDPYAIYALQEDGDTTPLTADECGENVDIIAGTGSTTTGRSNAEIDSDSNGTATAQLRLLGLEQPIDGNNAIGANARWLVLINEHELKSTTGV